jgi:hypothetical protein
MPSAIIYGKGNGTYDPAGIVTAFTKLNGAYSQTGFKVKAFGAYVTPTPVTPPPSKRGFSKGFSNGFG